MPDSGAVATLVGSMCQLVAKAIRENDETAISDVERWLEKDETPDVFTDPCVLANRLLYTCYIGTENSSRETQKRAKQLAEQIGASHLNINMDGLVTPYNRFLPVSRRRHPDSRRGRNVCGKPSPPKHTGEIADGD